MWRFCILKETPQNLVINSEQVLNIVNSARRLVKKCLPTLLMRALYKHNFISDYCPAIKKIAYGDLGRVTPFSTQFGFDRGGPIDRYYIEKFLSLNAALIKGRALEIGDNKYTVHFGGPKISTSDILHVDPGSQSATIIADLSHAPHIQSNTFDCIILTQTLQFIYDFKKALETCYRILRPGGALLITVPGITPLDQGELRSFWFWTFTNNSMSKLSAEMFPDAQVKIESYGNVFAATAFLYGIGLIELNEKELNHHDINYQVIVSVRVIKPVRS